MLKMLKPSFKQILSRTHGCYNAKIDSGESLFSGMHYHPEVELILIKRSAGTRIVGNSVESFADNDLVLIGANTPHAFLHEEQFLRNKEIVPQAWVVQFAENFLGNEFLRIPELKEINDLLAKSRHGLAVTEEGKDNIIPLVEKLFSVPSLDGIIILLEILKQLARQENHHVLISSSKFHSYATGINDQRFNDILDYTYANYDEHISIEKVAKIANLTRESFCRYFKSLVNKTYIEFLTEYRINKACEMIREGNKSIKEIGYSCGFDSLSNFYYQFKRITRLSPLEYSRQHLKGFMSRQVA